MSISIFTITHVPFTPPDNPIYIPLQAGRALHDDYGYIGDDTGDNISSLNPYYSELTGLYWIWKNYTEADYLGLCQYRRYFLNGAGQLMSETDYMDILSEYDVMIAKPSSGPCDYRTVYGRSHDIRNLDLAGETIRKLFPDYYDTFQSVISDCRCYVGNLFVAPKALFHAYCEWLFAIFFAMEPQIDLTNYDDYHKRVFGFLSEQLLIVWIKQNHLACYEAQFGLSQAQSETILLKNSLKNDMKESDLDVLIRHFGPLVKILEKIKNGTVSEEELNYLTDCKTSCEGIIYIIRNFPTLANQPLELLNQLAAVYADAGLFLVSLRFLEEALSIKETDKTTLSNIVAVLQNMGQTEMAAEYEQLLHSNSSKRIVTFCGFHIPILNYISAQYSAALEALGHTVLRFNMQKFEQSFESLAIFRQHGLDGAVVFNNSGFQMRMQSGRSLWDLWNIPCYNIIVDHPMYYFDTLDHAPENGIVVCADRYHTDYVKRFYPTVKKTFFLPTAGECLKPYEKLKPFAERPIDVLFIGAYKYDDSLPQDKLARQLTAHLMEHPSEPFETALVQCIPGHSGLTDSQLKEYMQRYRFIDKNVCALFRLKILEALVHAGISVTVYGENFEKTPLIQYPNFIYKGRCSTEEGIRLMEESKISLNQLAWFKAGASERIFEAMLQGAVALTDSSAYLEETFIDSEDIRFYSLTRLNDLPGIVQSILHSGGSIETLRKKAYRKASEEHMWIHRASTLMDDLLQ